MSQITKQSESDTESTIMGHKVNDFSYTHSEKIVYKNIGCSEILVIQIINKISSPGMISLQRKSF